MTILFLASRAFSLFRGGIERFSIVLGQRFKSDGHNVIYLSAINDLSPTEEEELGIDVPHLYLPNMLQINSYENQKYLISVCKEYKIDILFNQQADSRDWIKLCSRVTRETNVHLVTILHLDPNHYIDRFQCSFSDIRNSGLSFREQLGLYFRNTTFYRYRQQLFFGRTFSLAIRKSDAFVLLSHNARPRLLRMVGNVDESKIVAISNPVTVDSFLSVSPEKRKQILFVGRMVFASKRPDLLIQIWSRLCNDFPDWELIVLGDGDYLPTIRHKVLMANIPRVHFIGCANSQQYYESASILCMTSNTEGFPLVTVEASQNYVVPLAFDSFPGASDVIRQGITGFIIPPFDIEAYANRLRQLMSNPKLCQEMAEAAHEYVQIFNMDRIAPRWYELFESITHKS